MLNLFEIENVYFDQWINILYFFFFLTKYFFGILYFKIIFQKLLGNEHFIGIERNH